MSNQHRWMRVVKTIFRLSSTLSALIVLSMIESVASGAPAFKQKKDGQITSGQTSTVSFSSSTTAGNLLVIYLIWDSTGSASVTDSLGNQYIGAVGPTRWSNGSYSAQTFYAINRSSGIDKVTAKFGTAVKSFGIVYAHEYSGISTTSPVDVVAAASGASGNLDSGAATTTNDVDLLFGGGVSATRITSSGSAFIYRSTFQGNMTEDRNVTVRGSYRATATNSSGAWAMQMVAFKSAASGALDTTAPTIPTSIGTTAVTANSISLAWAASTDNVGVTGYKVFRGGVQIGTSATASYTDSNLSASTQYTYAVSAYDAAGNDSAQSASAQVTTSAATDTTAPTVPGGLTVSSTTSSTASLVWTASTDNIAVAGYRVYRSGVLAGTSTSTSFTDSGLAASTSYSYTVSAYDAAGNSSAQSAAVSAKTTTSVDSTSPSIPSGLAVTSTTATTVSLAWSASSDNVAVTGYRVYSGGVALGTTSATSYSVSGLTPATSYSYTVAAFDAAGNTSSPSAPISATTLDDTQAPSISITSPGTGQIVSGTINVSATGTDNVGIASVQFMVDGSNLGAALTASPYSISWNTAQVAAGAHALTAVARDAAGNTTTSSVVSVTVSAGLVKPYITTFSGTENPISEAGVWINGRTAGLDWGDVRTTPGFAFGTDSDTNYADPTAILTGVWGPDQMAQATVHTVNQNDSIFEEVELRLRSSITAHSNTGYEINFRCSKTSNAYSQVVRWNGALGDFTLLDARGGSQYGVGEGDVVKATIIGNVITVYINNVQKFQVTDNTYTSGNPGMGFYLQGATGVTSDYGFTSFMASDGISTDTAAPSTPLGLTANAVSGTQVNLAWSASTDNVAVTNYVVYRNNQQIAAPTVTSFSDTSVAAGTQYSYTVLAMDNAGNKSAQSAAVTVTTPFSADSIAPSAPLTLTATAISSTAITLSWQPSTDNVAVAGYRLYRDGAQVGSTTSLSYTDSGLSPVTTYTYTIAAYDASGNVSAQSQQASFTTVASPVTAPSFVQVNQNQIASGTNVSVGFNSATRAGNTLVVYLIWNNTGSATVTDSQGNTFTPVSAAVSWGSGYLAQVFYASNIVGGADSVTATFRTAVSSFGVLYVHEYSGISAVNPVDVSTSASGSSSTLNSGAILTTSANDLIFGAGVSDNFVTAAGSGFVARDLAFGNITEDRVAGTVGSYSATATHSGSAWGMQLVAFRSAQ